MEVVQLLKQRIVYGPLVLEETHIPTS